MWKRVIVVVVLCLAPTVLGQGVEKRGRELVARIDVEFPQLKKFGGGILFGRSQGQVFLVTAKHVVRDTAPPKKVTVTFGNLRQFDGSILADLKNTNLDVAVLSVKDDGLFADLFPVSVIPEAEAFVRGQNVYAVGHPYGMSWDIPVIPDQISGTAFPLVRFQSSFIREGNSGGALMDPKGLVLGMVIQDEQPTGIAINFPTILNILHDNGYSVQLRPYSEEQTVQALIGNLRDSASRSYELEYLKDLNTWVTFRFGPIEVSRCKITVKSTVNVGDSAKTIAEAITTSTIDLSNGGSIDLEHRTGSEMAESILGSAVSKTEQKFAAVVLRAGKLAVDSSRTTQITRGNFGFDKETKVTRQEKNDLIFPTDASAENFRDTFNKISKYCQVISKKE